MCSKLWTASHEPLLPWTLHTAHLFELALTRSSAALQGKTCKKSSGPHYRHCYNYFLYLTVQNEAKWASRNHRWDTCYTGTAPILHIISMAVITVPFIPRKVLWSSFADLPTYLLTITSPLGETGWQDEQTKPNHDQWMAILHINETYFLFLLILTSFLSFRRNPPLLLSGSLTWIYLYSIYQRNYLPCQWETVFFHVVLVVVRLTSAVQGICERVCWACLAQIHFHYY